MVDFLRISTRPSKGGGVEVFPKFIVGKSKDLMIRGGDFYAIWLEDRNLWSTDEQDVIDLIDGELTREAKAYQARTGIVPTVQYMWDSDSGVIKKWHTYCKEHMRNNFVCLNQTLIFKNQIPTKEDYVTSVLKYELVPEETLAYDRLMETLYTPENRHKIEWCIGAILTGASKKLEKFLVLYGEKGSGKSTIIKIMTKLFDGFYTVFDAKAIGSASKDFALEPFKENPLLAIQFDGDLSKLEDNTRLNSLTAHEKMIINEKHKSLYTFEPSSFLVMGTNNPVKITDAKSGLLRRLIDANPSGHKVTVKEYNQLMKQIENELGGIAYHCKEVYETNPTYYDNYEPTAMMGETNDFFNFVEDSYLIYKKDDKTTLKETWEMYKVYCEQAKVPYPFSMRSVRAELKNYFENYEEDYQDPKTGKHIRNLYYGFRYWKFDKKCDEESKEVVPEKLLTNLIDFVEQPSHLDDICKDCLAQYASSAETPSKKWENVTTTLKEINTSKLHYVKPPVNLIVIDFDIKDETGKKSFEKNLEAASKWPKTYAELSKSGSGIHLHYIYDGDPLLLSRIYDDDIEIKVFNGNASLRRKLIKCNNEPINHIDSGLPLKGSAGKVENIDIIRNEKALRTMIKRNLNKEYHPATKPSVDFIFKLLEDAYNSGMKYDVSDLYNQVLAFAAGSTHQAEYCLSLLPKMHFKPEDQSKSVDIEKPIVFFDVEVFPNLFLVNWKLQGKEHPVVRLINPKASDIEEILKYRLIGFNNRRYDNHMLYARLIGMSNEELYSISQKIVSGDKAAFFGEAYNLSYTDIYDYCNADNKMSLKKWEIKLGIHHLELGLPWDKPVPEHLWKTVAEYCDNDVISTEAVFDATQEDFLTRQILADLAGMSVNDTTNALTTRLILGGEKNIPLFYEDLSKLFPGYKFEKKWDDVANTYIKHNWYRNIDLGFGGFVDSITGMYYNVALLDIRSMHPNSIIMLKLLGEYTKNYEELVDARADIKHGNIESASKRFHGKLAKWLDPNKYELKKVGKSLKTPINSLYGLTSAKFKNPFVDLSKNENNIVALRGALFMKTLQDEVTKRGFIVAHIKTDSIKIPNATPEIIKFCMDFAKQYGYEFEHEATYEKMCLVNDAVYIAKYRTAEECQQMYGYIPEKNAKHGGLWTATGTQFQVPYVFKKCFSKEPIVFDDLCETKEVKTSIYLDYNEGKMDTSKLEKELYCITEGNREPERQEEIKKILIENHDRRFVGRIGLFCPIKPDCGGAELVAERTKKDGSVGYDALAGTKGYRWLEAENVKGKCEDNIDTSYYESLVNQAIEDINKYGDYYSFVSDDPVPVSFSKGEN